MNNKKPKNLETDILKTYLQFTIVAGDPETEGMQLEMWKSVKRQKHFERHQVNEKMLAKVGK